MRENRYLLFPLNTLKIISSLERIICLVVIVFNSYAAAHVDLNLINKATFIDLEKEEA